MASSLKSSVIIKNSQHIDLHQRPQRTGLTAKITAFCDLTLKDFGSMNVPVRLWVSAGICNAACPPPRWRATVRLIPEENLPAKMSPVCIPIKPFFPVRCIYFLPLICSCSHQCCQMFVRYLWSHLWCWTCLSSLPASSFIFIWEKEKMTFAFGFLINYSSLIYSVWIIQRLDTIGKKKKSI